MFNLLKFLLTPSSKLHASRSSTLPIAQAGPSPQVLPGGFAVEPRRSRASRAMAST
jgi:hypothetical protein